METNRHGVTTEPFRWYWIKHEESERGKTPTLAIRVRNSWEYIDRTFAAYDQFVTEAIAATDTDLKKHNISNQE